MGWWGRQWRRTRNYTSENAGKVARAAAVGGAGIAGSLIPGCGPICGVAAAAAVDSAFGAPIERNVRKATDKGAREVQGWLDNPEGPAPPGLRTTPTGVALRARGPGGARRFANADPVGDQRAAGKRRQVLQVLTVMLVLAAGATVLARRGR